MNNVTPLQVKKVLTGNFSFSQLGFSMMITRLKTIYAKDPSQITLQNCTNEVNLFINKFQAIMGQDYALISKL